MPKSRQKQKLQKSKSSVSVFKDKLTRLKTNYLGDSIENGILPDCKFATIEHDRLDGRKIAKKKSLHKTSSAKLSSIFSSQLSPISFDSGIGSKEACFVYPITSPDPGPLDIERKNSTYTTLTEVTDTYPFKLDIRYENQRTTELSNSKSNDKSKSSAVLTDRTTSADQFLSNDYTKKVESNKFNFDNIKKCMSVVQLLTITDDELDHDDEDEETTDQGMDRWMSIRSDYRDYDSSATIKNPTTSTTKFDELSILASDNDLHLEMQNTLKDLESDYKKVARKISGQMSFSSSIRSSVFTEDISISSSNILEIIEEQELKRLTSHEISHRTLSEPPVSDTWVYRKIFG